MEFWISNIMQYLFMAKSEVFLTQMASVPIAEIMAGNFSPDFCSTWTDCPCRNLQNYMKDENITNFQLCTFRLKIRKSIFFRRITVRWKFQPFPYLASKYIKIAKHVISWYMSRCLKFPSHRCTAEKNRCSRLFKWIC